MLSGGVSARHILRHGFPKLFGNLLLKWRSSGAYMPCRSWPEGPIASSAVTSPLSLGQRGIWQRGCKDHCKPLLHPGPGLSTCMVQAPLLHPWGTGEEMLPAALGPVLPPRAAPMAVPSHGQALLGAEGVEVSTVRSSGRASVQQACDQNLSRIWPSPLMKVCIFPMGCASLCYSLIFLPRSF